MLSTVRYDQPHGKKSRRKSLRELRFNVQRHNHLYRAIDVIDNGTHTLNGTQKTHCKEGIAFLVGRPRATVLDRVNQYKRKQAIIAFALPLTLQLSCRWQIASGPNRSRNRKRRQPLPSHDLHQRQHKQRQRQWHIKQRTHRRQHKQRQC